MVSTENVRKLMEMAQDASGCGDDGAGQAYADTANCLKELLAFREGYDPKKTLPEVGRVVRVKTWYNSYRDASLISDNTWCWNGEPHALTSVSRWYPMPGGE